MMPFSNCQLQYEKNTMIFKQTTRVNLRLAKLHNREKGSHDVNLNKNESFVDTEETNILLSSQSHGTGNEYRGVIVCLSTPWE
jgi:hypothetical protein